MNVQVVQLHGVMGVQTATNQAQNIPELHHLTQIKRVTKWLLIQSNATECRLMLSLRVPAKEN